MVFQVFVFRDGEFQGTEMAAGPRFEAGRDPSCAVVVADELASRQHFRVSARGADVVLEDQTDAALTPEQQREKAASMFRKLREQLGGR